MKLLGFRTRTTVDLGVEGGPLTGDPYSYSGSKPFSRGCAIVSAMKIQLTSDWHRGKAARVIPGAYWDAHDKAWVALDPTPRAAAVILKLFPELSVVHPELLDLRGQLTSDVRPFDNATPYNRPLDKDILNGITLYDFQAIDAGYIAAILRRDGAGYIGHERGLGKTASTLAIMRDLGVSCGLVVCPNTAKSTVWASEVERLLPSHEVIVMGNSPGSRLKAFGFMNQCDELNKPYVMVTHYESMAIIAGKGKTKTGRVSIGDGWKQYGTWDLVVFDEAHRLWNTKTQMYKAARKIPREKTLMLSGSILMNHAEELYGPLSLMYPDRYKSKWRDWNNRYLDYVDSGYGRVCVGVKPDKIEAMRTELGVFMVYRRKSDELDLPSRTEQTLRIDLTPAQHKAYDELVAASLARLDDGTVIKAAEGLALLTKLRQVATGLDLVGDSVTDSSKLDSAMQMIEDSDEPTVVFSWYRQSARSLAERCRDTGIPVFCVDGDTPHAERARAIEEFQQSQGKAVFVGTLSTISESVTLHNASHAIFIDRSWNPATNIQAADRIYRIGQTKPVTITHLVARDTVDEHNVLPTLTSKEALRRLILGGD